MKYFCWDFGFGSSGLAKVRYVRFFPYLVFQWRSKPPDKKEAAALTVYQRKEEYIVPAFSNRPIIIADRLEETALDRRISEAVNRSGFDLVTPSPGETVSELVNRLSPALVLFHWIGDGSQEIPCRIERSDDRVPVAAISEKIELFEVPALLERGIEDCFRPGTPLELIQARIGSIVKTKLHYDRIIRSAYEETLRDPLTGLWNHRHFQDLLRVDMSRMARSGSNVALLMVDIDNFKAINDNFGHPVGDVAIRMAAETIADSIRSGDIAARYGGEEFGVILPQASRAEAYRIAGRIRRNIERRLVKTDGVKFNCTVSSGTALFPEDAHTAGDLVAAADVALYQAKRQGRNRVESVRWMPFEFMGSGEIERVGVGGDWNGWTPARAELNRVGKAFRNVAWENSILLPTGRNRYKFKVHSRTGHPLWITDLSNALAEPDGFGGANSIRVVDDYEEALAA